MTTIESGPCPEPLRPRYRSLDLWRGVACLMVVVYHAALCVPGADRGATAGVYALLNLGYLGVPLFFVISGYCIAATSDAHRRSNRPGGEFVRRRVRRIYPPFWIALAGLAALLIGSRAVGWDVFRWRPLRLAELSTLAPFNWLGNLTLTETWLHHVVGGERSFANVVTWSLCYEEQFYLICFLMLLLARRHFFRALAAITAGVTIVWLALAACGREGCVSGTFVDFGWWQFVCGAGVYWRLNHVRSASLARVLDGITMVVAAGLLGLFGLLAARDTGPDSYLATPWLGLAVALTFAVALVWLRPLDHWMTARRGGALLCGVGTFSYSMYLIHMPVCKLVYAGLFRLGCWTPARALVLTIPATAVASVLTGWGFYRLVERRFLNPSLKRVATVEPARASGGVAALPASRREVPVCAAQGETVALVT